MTSELYAPTLEVILNLESERPDALIRSNDDVHISLSALAAIIDIGITVNLDKVGREAEPALEAVTTFMSWVPMVIEHHYLLKGLEDGIDKIN